MVTRFPPPISFCDVHVKEECVSPRACCAPCQDALRILLFGRVCVEIISLLGVSVPGTEGSKFEWLLFDSHPRDYSASIGRQPSAVVGFSSLGALAEHLGTIIPPFIDPEGGEGSC